MNNYGYDSISATADALKNVMDVDKKIKEEASKGSMANDDKISRMMFEQMLRGLYITEDPTSFNRFVI